MAPHPDSVPRHPPRLALWLLEHRIPEHEREFLVGDLVERFQEGGDTPDARRQARRRFWRESLTASVRREHDHHAIPFSRGFMTDLGFDVTLAMRRLRRTPGFTLAASLTLALGVGAACAITAVAGPALWGALPFRDADRIVTLRETFGDGSRGRVGFQTISDIRRQSATLESVAAASYWSPTLVGESEASRLTGLSVSSRWLEVMGSRVAIGRGFTPEEDVPNGEHVAILDHQFWQQRFGGDSAIVGRTIKLGDVDYRVVGVLPPEFEHVLRPRTEIIRPLRYADSSGSACRDCRHLQAVARVKQGVPLDAAARDVEAIFAKLRTTYPDVYGSNGLVVTPLRDEMIEKTRGPLYALLGAAALLLLIALANTTNLFVARGIQRGGESTIRAALGANRWRLARSMLIEALLVSTLGALFGLALANAAIGALVALAPASLPRIDQVRIGGSTTMLAIGLAVALGMVSGLVPALFVEARGLRDRLAASSRTVARGAHDVVRRGLVVVELSLALLLLGGAGILVQSVRRLLAVDVGFATNDRLSLALSGSGARFQDNASAWQVWRSVQESAHAIPGVQDAALTSQLPLSSDFDSYGLHWEKTDDTHATGGSDAFRFAVTSDYANTMGIPVLSGRFLAATDRESTEPVVVINDVLARQQFGDRSPIGARVKMGPESSPWRTVVGVVGNVRHPALDADLMPQIYLPMDQNHFADSYMRLVVHSTLDPSTLSRTLRDVVHGVDPTMPIADVATLSSLVDDSAMQRRFAERLFQVFSLSALILAAVGIFGVLSGMVGERVREIGVRSALGASRGQILGHFLRQGGTLAAVGIAVGTVGVTLLGSALRPLVYGISPRDPVTITVVALGLGCVAILATMIPAWRASRVDAMVALRAE